MKDPNLLLTHSCPMGRGLLADRCFSTQQYHRGLQPSLLAAHAPLTPLLVAPSPLSPAACVLVQVFPHFPSTGEAEQLVALSLPNGKSYIMDA